MIFFYKKVSPAPLKPLPHLPKQIAEVGSAVFAGGNHEEFGDFEVFRVTKQNDKHFTNEVCAKGDVVVGTNSELDSFFFPP